APQAFGLDNQGNLTIVGNALAPGGNTITIGVNSAGGMTVTVNKAMAVLAPGAVKQIIGMTHIVAGKSSNDNWDVEGTPAGVPMTLSLGPGDIVYLGKSQSLSNIGGNVTINGGSGNGTLNVSDGSDTGASHWTINSTAVSWQSVSGVTSSV